MITKWYCCAKCNEVAIEILEICHEGMAIDGQA